MPGRSCARCIAALTTLAPPPLNRLSGFPSYNTSSKIENSTPTARFCSFRCLQLRELELKHRIHRSSGLRSKACLHFVSTAMMSEGLNPSSGGKQEGTHAKDGRRGVRSKAEKTKEQQEGGNTESKKQARNTGRERKESNLVLSLRCCCCCCSLLCSDLVLVFLSCFSLAVRWEIRSLISVVAIAEVTFALLHVCDVEHSTRRIRIVRS